VFGTSGAAGSEETSLVRSKSAQHVRGAKEVAMPYGAQGRPVSWMAVGAIILGFIIGGLGLVLGPTWWLFWVGVVVTAAGGIFAWAIDIMEDYDTAAH